mmetsp:Transcript_21762/g.61773  ORF Transcript_21762/g.61773 Transcript_21762/m.61773 type:complete len:226 (-) Transcript_21762:811-1488(-)
MSRSWSKATCTSADDQHLPRRCCTASRAAACSQRSMAVTSNVRRKCACSSSERCSSPTICASSSMLRESKYSRMDSRSSARKCRWSPEPQTLRECMGVWRWTLRTTSTPFAPPNRILLALRRNSAGSNSCSTAPIRNATSASVTLGLSLACCPAAPSSRETPICTSASSNSQPSDMLWRCASILSTRFLFSARRPSPSRHAAQNACAGGPLSEASVPAIATTSWW